MKAREITAKIALVLFGIWGIVIGFFGGFYPMYVWFGDVAETNTLALVATFVFPMITSVISLWVIEHEAIDWFYEHDWFRD